MDLIIVLISIEIIASKFLDSYIASYTMQGNYRERNPILEKIFSRLQIQEDPWLSFFVTVLLTGIAVYLFNTLYATTALQLLFIFTGCFTTVLNLGAAHGNYFQRTNFITRRLLR